MSISSARCGVPYHLPSVLSSLLPKDYCGDSVGRSVRVVTGVTWFFVLRRASILTFVTPFPTIPIFWAVASRYGYYTANRRCRLSSTARTPGVARAAATASRCHAQLGTVPVSHTTPFLTSTVMSLK